MKFWEAMKALDEGKKVKNVYWRRNEYIYKSSIGSVLDENANSFSLGSRQLSYEWEILEDPVKLFSFNEVVKGIKEGKTYRRRESDGDYQLNEHGYTQCGTHPNSCLMVNHFISLKSIFANDWVEVK